MEIKRPVSIEQRIWCPRKCSFDETMRISKCSDCVFFNGLGDYEIKCLYDANILLRRMHITEFICNDYIYRAKRVSELPEEVVSKVTDEDNGYCSLCCFNTKLSNGVDICLLRQSASSDEIDNFCCYDDEIWTQEKIER
jgi:hypothetical protein